LYSESYTLMKKTSLHTIHYVGKDVSCGRNEGRYFLHTINYVGKEVSWGRNKGRILWQLHRQPKPVDWIELLTCKNISKKLILIGLFYINKYKVKVVWHSPHSYHIYVLSWWLFVYLFDLTLPADTVFSRKMFIYMYFQIKWYGQNMCH
jgi:hypothetical protein